MAVYSKYDTQRPSFRSNGQQKSFVFLGVCISMITLDDISHSQEHIEFANTYKSPIYYTLAKFIKNTPRNQHGVIFDQEKGKPCDTSTSKKAKAIVVYGFCEKGPVNLSMKKFNPIKNVDRYTYFREKGVELGLIYVLGPTPLAIHYPSWYKRKYMADPNNSNTCGTNKKTLKMIFDSDPTLYEEFMNDKKWRKRYQYYVGVYNNRNRKELKSLPKLRETKPELFQIENKYNKNKQLPN